MADSVVKKHPFGGSWAIVRFRKVYGRQKCLEGDGFRWSEEGHGGGRTGVVVVIEQVKTRSGAEADCVRDHIGTKES